METKLIYTDNPTDFNIEDVKEQIAFNLDLSLDEKDSISQEEIDNSISKQKHTMYNNFISNIYDYVRKYRVAGFLLKGEINHWNGVCCGFTLVEGVDDIINTITADTACVFQTNDEPLQLQGKGTHHDGTNYYTIMTITQRGIDYVKLHGDYYGDMTASEMYSYLEKNKLVRPFFSRNRKLGK